MGDETLTGRPVRGRSLVDARPIAKPGILRGSVLPTTIVAVAAVMVDTAGAATFKRANLQEAKKLCTDGATTGNLTANCGSVELETGILNPGASSASIGSSAAPSAALAIQERLRTARKGGGASSDEVVSLGQGLSVFASSGAEALTHLNNHYEDGYQSTIPSVTFGADYQVTPWLVAGSAFNYFNFNGEYDDGGQFNTNSFGPIAYLSFLPFDNTFADVTLGYARKDYFRDRRARIFDQDMPNNNPIRGLESGGNGGNEYSATLLLGYDYPIENFTIGPRIALNYIATQIDDYREHGNTGLELRYSGQDTSSLQSSLGAVATAAISTQFGVLLPQVSASWVHDYDVGGRNIDASFVDATEPSKFKFKREPVAPNFANIGVGVSALLPNNWQPFVNFKTIQGNENLVSYGGTAGLRVGL